MHFIVHEFLSTVNNSYQKLGTTHTAKTTPIFQSTSVGMQVDCILTDTSDCFIRVL